MGGERGRIHIHSVLGWMQYAHIGVYDEHISTIYVHIQEEDECRENEDVEVMKREEFVRMCAYPLTLLSVPLVYPYPYIHTCDPPPHIYVRTLLPSST